jgi:hypothetical protein
VNSTNYDTPHHLVFCRLLLLSPFLIPLDPTIRALNVMFVSLRNVQIKTKKITELNVQLPCHAVDEVHKELIIIFYGLRSKH